MWALTLVAEIIGFIVMGAIGLMLLTMAGSYVHDLIRTSNLRYDLYLYDDVARWNKRQRKLAGRKGPPELQGGGTARCNRDQAPHPPRP